MTADTTATTGRRASRHSGGRAHHRAVALPGEVDGRHPGRPAPRSRQPAWRATGPGRSSTTTASPVTAARGATAAPGHARGWSTAQLLPRRTGRGARAGPRRGRGGAVAAGSDGRCAWLASQETGGFVDVAPVHLVSTARWPTRPTPRSATPATSPRRGPTSCSTSPDARGASERDWVGPDARRRRRRLTLSQAAQALPRGLRRRRPRGDADGRRRAARAEAENAGEPGAARSIASHAVRMPTVSREDLPCQTCRSPSTAASDPSPPARRPRRCCGERPLGRRRAGRR